jgi:hypothetical protein
LTDYLQVFVIIFKVYSWALAISAPELLRCNVFHLIASFVWRGCGAALRIARYILVTISSCELKPVSAAIPAWTISRVTRGCDFVSLNRAMD